MGDHAVGYIAMAIAAFGFGSNYIPVKRCPTGDGLSFQFFFCAAVWALGLMVGGYTGFPRFHPLAMLGGFLWATGNIVSVPAIKLVGMGLAVLIWGSSNMIMGWASGTFGLFGLKRRAVKHADLNYAGVAVAIVALLIYLGVKPEDTSKAKQKKAIEKRGSSEGFLSDNLGNELMENGVRDTENTGSVNGDNHGHDVFLPKLSGARRTTLGACLALAAGALYGTSFDPSQYIIDHAEEPGSIYHGALQETLGYVFAHFTGIFITSLAYFIIYCFYKQYVRKEAPQLYPETILPAMASGALWAIAMIAWFVANGNINSFAVTFPIVTSLPGGVAALWGVLVFGEIKGTRNLLTLGAAFCCTILACVLIAMSM